VSVETCDDQIAQDNDHFKREVNKLKKQAKVQPPQDNYSNVVKKLEKGRTATKIASQPSKKHVQNEKDEKVEYARSVFLNARRSHIKNEIDYKNSDNRNSRVNTKGKEFIKFTKAIVQQEKKQQYDHLVCCTSDLKLVMLEKYTFLSKILFTQNFIHAL
jgi:hypothetical protein